MAVGVIGAATKGMMLFRKSSAVESDVMEPDPDEEELRNFEANCRLLNSKQYTGFRRLQVETWLLFEDQTSSWYAQVVQFSMFVLIVFSTALILAQSHGECRWVSSTPSPAWVGVSFRELVDDLHPCDDLSLPMFVNTSCYRVCDHKLEPFDKGGCGA
jgi:hypothetical protein